MVFQETRGLICTNFGGDIVWSLLHTKWKNGLLGFQTTAAQTGALSSDKAKNRTFDHQ